jgi:hypothetical protein
MNRMWLMIAVVMSMAATGCFTVKADLPGTVRTDVAATDYKKIGELKIEKTNWFFVFGLVGAPGPDFFAPEIAAAVRAKGGDGVVNLKIMSEHTFGDVCISCVALSGLIVAPRTYVVTGDIIRFGPSVAAPAGAPVRVTPQPAKK